MRGFGTLVVWLIIAKMYSEVSAPMKVVDCIIPEPWFKMFPEVLAPVKVVGLHHP